MRRYEPSMLDKKLEELSKELPVGCVVTVSVERGAGWVTLEVDDCNIVEQLDIALRLAMSQTRGATGPDAVQS